MTGNRLASRLRTLVAICHIVRVANISAESGACPGMCNTRWREARDAYTAALEAYERDGILDAAQSRPEPPQIQPVLGVPVWCGRCTSRIRQCLSDLDELAAMLGWIADGHSASTAASLGRVSGSSEPVSPSDAADELRDLMNVLTEHENAFRDFIEIGPPQARRGYLASASSQCIAWLGHHLDDVLASPVAEGFGHDVLEWQKGWKTRAKAGKRKLVKPLRCPGCQLLTLVWTEGDDRVECGNPDCSRIYTYAEYEQMVEERAASPTRFIEAETDLSATVLPSGS